MIPRTSFRLLHESGACPERYRYLARHLGGIRNYGQDTPITLPQILDICGFVDSLWALRACTNAELFSRLLGCDYVEHVLCCFEDEYPNIHTPRRVIETVRQYLDGKATEHEITDVLQAARAIARNIPSFTAGYVALAAVWVADGEAITDIAGAAASASPSWEDERRWQEQHLREKLFSKSEKLKVGGDQ